MPLPEADVSEASGPGVGGCLLDQRCNLREESLEGLDRGRRARGPRDEGKLDGRQGRVGLCSGAERVVELQNKGAYVGVGSRGEELLDVVALVDAFGRRGEYVSVEVGLGKLL